MLKRSKKSLQLQPHLCWTLKRSYRQSGNPCRPIFEHTKSSNGEQL
uniref:Uncharacterized protein n=1 Tax=Arundo donax TaxID=35708 RepID=A0A0A9HFG5_ARUDO